MAILKLKGVDLFVRKSGEDVGDWPHVKYRGLSAISSMIIVLSRVSYRCAAK